MTVREETQALERQTMSPYAMLSADTKGRKEPEEECELRTPFQRDRDRIILVSPSAGSNTRHRCFCRLKATITAPV